MNEKLKEVLDKYCDFVEALAEYGLNSKFFEETGCYIGGSINICIVEGLFAFAESVGEKPKKDNTRVMVDPNGDITMYYEFHYRGVKFYDFVLVGNTNAMEA